MKRVFFIRHAESAANAGLKTGSDELIPLSLLGQSQAQKLAEIFTVTPELVIVSPYLRTQETARPYTQKHQKEPEVWGVHEFSYLNGVAFQNTTASERYSDVQKYWDAADIYHNAGDGAESFHEFVNRATAIRNQLISRSENIIVIFSHGHFMRLFSFIDSMIREGKNPSATELQEYMLEHSAFLRAGGKFRIENTEIREFEF
jgi:probable phosphoglycerate mutase